MGIDQRNLETLKEKVSIENQMKQQNCINCRTYCMQNPEKMLFHMRSKLSRTILKNEDKMHFFDTNKEQML